MTTTIENQLIKTISELGKNSHDGPEGLYNEFSLANELINHLIGKGTIDKDIWYDSFYIWENYVTEDISVNYDDDEWNEYLDLFNERMDLLYDISLLVFK